jgi:hypothetical protein
MRRPLDIEDQKTTSKNHRFRTQDKKFRFQAKLSASIRPVQMSIHSENGRHFAALHALCAKARQVNIKRARVAL